MLVPVVVAPSTSPSPAHVPPVIASVALASLRLSASLTAAVGDRVMVCPWNDTAAEAATFEKVGASLILVMLTVEVTGVLTSVPPLAVPLGSIKVQVSVRVAFEPKLVGFSPALKATESRNDW